MKLSNQPRKNPLKSSEYIKRDIGESYFAQMSVTVSTMTAIWKKLAFSKH
jgi:hypothetical protein